MSKQKQLILKISLSGLFLALGLVLPFLTGQIPEIGSMLCPMHIPVLICGFVCGWKYGLIVGVLTPLLRSFIFSMPPLYPGAIGMAFELGTYGLVSGLLFSLLNKKYENNLLTIIFVLIISMLAGRIIWGIARYAMSLFDKSLVFTFQVFISGAFLTAWPGIILQIILIPTLIYCLQRANLIPLEK